MSLNKPVVILNEPLGHASVSGVQRMNKSCWDTLGLLRNGSIATRGLKPSVVHSLTRRGYASKADKALSITPKGRIAYDFYSASDGRKDRLTRRDFDPRLRGYVGYGQCVDMHRLPKGP